MPPPIVGVHEIAVLLGVSRQRVHQLTQTLDFPVPVYRLKAGTFWLLADVHRWANDHGRPLK